MEKVTDNHQDTNPGSNPADIVVQQALTFQLSGEVYGMDILDIREIIEYSGLTPVPMMPDFIEGVINLRGSVVPIVSLAKRFQLPVSPVTKRTSVIVLEVEDVGEKIEIGLIVDYVNEVLDIDEKEICSAPSFGSKIRAEFIKGMAKIDEKFLVLLDVESVLSVEELSALKETSARDFPSDQGKSGGSSDLVSH